MVILNMRSHKIAKIAALFVFGIIIGASAFMLSPFSPHPLLLSFDSSNVPLITANPIDINRVFSVSDFRSDAGHDFSVGAWDGETCRSMKNYFNWSQYQVNGQPVRSKATPDHPNINIYAPFDGKIVADVAEHTPIGRQIHIASAKDPHYVVTIFHIDLLAGLRVGSQVTSGQPIGTIGPMDGIDVAYEANLWNFKTVYMSIFDHMTAQAFAPYAALGYKTSDFVLTRALADAKHYQCSNGQFVHPASFYRGNTDLTEGYEQIRPNPYAYLWHNNNSSVTQTNLINPNQQMIGNLH